MAQSERGIKDAIIPAQVRAGRALLNWSQDQLAEASGTPKRTIARLELGDGVPRDTTLSAVRAALEVGGVIFVDENGDGPGVRLRKGRPV